MPCLLQPRSSETAWCLVLAIELARPMTQTKTSLCPAFRLAGITLISSGLLHGADTPKDKPAQELPVTVVTATKTETEADKTASSITVIDRAKIEQEQYRLLADALRIVPGMTVINPGVTGNVATVLTRGTATKDTMLLIDGRPMPYNLAGSFNLETMALDNVERVEVLRGPAASLYGGRTMGGVINVITRSGRGLEKPETTAFFEAGSYGTFREGVSTLGAAGDLDWGFEASRTDTQGQRINSQYQQSNAAGKIGYQIAEDLRFDLDLRYYTADVGVPGSTAVNDSDNHLLTEFWSISPRLIWDTTENWQQTLTFSHSEFRQVATGFTGFFQTNNRVSSRSDWLEYQSTVKVLEDWTLTAGAWFQDQNITRYNDTAQVLDIDQNQTNWALFLQSQAEVLPGLNLLGGLRYDSFSDFEEAVTWRAGISYRVPVLKTLLHANYGTAYTPPTPQDLTPVFGGNPNLLDPERSRGYEIGIEQPLSDNQLLLRATWFRNDIEDTYQYLPPFFIPTAVGEATTSGVESGIQWTPCQSFSANLNYTYLDATDDTNEARLVRRPRHSINGGITVKPHDDVTVSLSAVYVIDREDFTFAGQSDVEDFLNVRLSATWRVTKNVEIFGRIENLRGDQYEEIPGFPALDTGAYAGVKLRF
jgi:vitamin B12 transporter